MGGKSTGTFWGKKRFRGVDQIAVVILMDLRMKSVDFGCGFGGVEQDRLNRLYEPTVGACVGDACSGFHKPSVMPDYTFEFRYFRAAIAV
jgi:hypothetical protein